MSIIRNVNIHDESGVAYSDTNPLKVEIPPKVSTNNSSSTPLGISGVFTGTSEEVNGYGYIYVNVYSDVASAANGLSIEQSSDGTNWDHCDTYTIPAATGKNYSINPYAKYFRIVYTNGGTGQAAFRLQTILKGVGKSSSHRVQDSVTSQDDAELVLAVIAGEDPSGSFNNVQTTADGYLAISDNSNGLSIAEGSVTGKTFVHKFGNAPDFDTADSDVTIWDGADDGNSDLMTYTYSATADIDRISSSNNGDTQDIEIQGLDTGGALVTQTITLTGQTAASLSTSLKRVFRMKNVGSTDLAGRVYCFVNTTTTLGVPDTLANVRAEINNGNNQTLMAIYTIPTAKTGYLRSWFASTAGASRSTNYIIKLKARPSGQVFQLKHVSSIADAGSSFIQHEYVEPEVFSAGTDIELTAQMTAAGGTSGSVAAGFDIVLVDD